MTESEYRGANAVGTFQKHLRGFQDLRNTAVADSVGRQTPGNTLHGDSLSLTTDRSAGQAVGGTGIQIHEPNNVEVINGMEEARQDVQTVRRPLSQPADDEEAERDLYDLKSLRTCKGQQSVYEAG